MKRQLSGKERRIINNMKKNLRIMKGIMKLGVDNFLMKNMQIEKKSKKIEDHRKDTGEKNMSRSQDSLKQQNHLKYRLSLYRL